VSLEVIDGGLLTTVQDAGRPGWTHLGVPIGGACDQSSLAIANLLAGNPSGAAGLEMTLLGGTYRARAQLRIGLAGADLGGHVRETGRPLQPGRAHVLAAGATIAFPGVADVRAGARAYIALPGGIDVPVVLDSRATALASAFGGVDGRAVRGGDIVRAARREPEGGTRPPAIWPAEPSDLDTDGAIRVIAGPWGSVDELVGRSWRVGAGSDRIGLRLEGEPIDLVGLPTLPSFGVVPGGIQLPADGMPIVLLADAQTTGGYPIIAVAIAADMQRLAQLRPGAEFRFEEVSIALATEALRGQAAAFERRARVLREVAGWDDAWQGAGG
jgi:biotin-dependent carboxylase-like uncharacterized protein